VSLSHPQLPSLPCPVLTSSPTSITCAAPEGAGTGWEVVVWNVEPSTNTSQSSQPSQPSGPSQPPALLLSYLPPHVTSLHQPVPGQSPARGGFIVRISGENLSSRPVVTVAGRPCVVVQGASVPHTEVVCVAPEYTVGASTEVLLTAVDQAVVAGVLR
jgi:hypothetical protein